MKSKHQSVQKASRPLAAAAAGEGVQSSIGRVLLDDFSHAPVDGKPSACPFVLHNTSLRVVDLQIHRLHTCCLSTSTKKTNETI